MWQLGFMGGTHGPGHLLQVASGYVVEPDLVPSTALRPSALSLNSCCMHCRWLLGSIVVLGLVHGVAFSASYQMVSRFANKNTISLGLGCVGSGLLVLFIEVAMQLGPKPSRTASIILFETVAGGSPQTMCAWAFAATPVTAHLKSSPRRRLASTCVRLWQVGTSLYSACAAFAATGVCCSFLWVALSASSVTAGDCGGRTVCIHSLDRA